MVTRESCQGHCDRCGAMDRVPILPAALRTRSGTTSRSADIHTHDYIAGLGVLAAGPTFQSSLLARRR